MIAAASPEINEILHDILEGFYKPTPKQKPWEWCRDNVDYGLVSIYETPYHNKFDPDLFPYWKDVVEAAIDYDVREVVVLKASRAAASECILLNLMRYHVACDPMPILYLGAQEEPTKKFHRERIVEGFKLSKVTAKKLQESETVGETIYFKDCSVTSSYPGSRSVTKGFGYPLLLADEFSTYPHYSSAMLDKRIGTYRYGHIVKISSPDPQQKRSSDEDPIFIEFLSGDQRYWMMPDPKTGNLFKFEMGSDETAHGLKWDKTCKREDGTWDFQKVYETAHYVTPDGTIILNKDKQGIVQKGKFIPTNTEKATRGKRSYHVNAFYTAFPEGDFGHIACKFLQANMQGPEALRVFIYEFLAEKWYGEKIINEDSQLEERKGNYLRGQRISQVPAYADLFKGKKAGTLCQIDVQKDELYFNIREFIDGGDSGLVDWGVVGASNWKEIKEVAVRYGVIKIFIDNSYADRQDEVYEQCLYGVMKGAIPTFGRAKLDKDIEAKHRDPFEGRAGQGRHKIPMITFNPDRIKNKLAMLISGVEGHLWLFPKNVTDEYLRHMASEQSIDGQWKKKDRANHWWDNEVQAIVGAKALRIYREVEINYEIQPDQQKPREVATYPDPKMAQQQAKPRVVYPTQQDDDWDD